MGRSSFCCFKCFTFIQQIITNPDDRTVRNQHRCLKDPLDTGRKRYRIWNNIHKSCHGIKRCRGINKQSQQRYRPFHKSMRSKNHNKTSLFEHIFTATKFNVRRKAAERPQQRGVLAVSSPRPASASLRQAILSNSVAGL